jgi:hypothetical protein
MKMTGKHIGKIVMSEQEKSHISSCFQEKSWVVLAMLALMLFLASCASVSAPPPPEASSTSTYKEGVPGGVYVRTVEMSARVVAIDHFNREATLLESEGKQFTVKVGPEAVNFDQIQVGDLVKITVAEQMVVHLDKENKASIGGAAAVVGLGAQAGGLAAEAWETIATVTEIDREKRTATLQFQDGSTRTVPVRSDIDLSKHKIGEKVVFHITEMVAIEIEKQ